ncbi:MAG: Uma2 family endonuclease [Steroidobacteraceae bacterium]
MISKSQTESRMTPSQSRQPITVEEYYTRAQIGLIDPDARVELIEGEVVHMAPIGNRHGYAVDLLNMRLCALADDKAIVRVQGALRLSNITELQPDISLLKMRNDRYLDSQACGPDALLVVEVSDTTLRKDLDVKLPLYARYGVPEVWVVDLQNDRIRFHRTPQGGSYGEVTSAMKPGSTPVPGLPAAEIDLARVLAR